MKIENVKFLKIFSVLMRGLERDVTFLTENNIIDYSLLVGINNEKNVLTVGLIDYIRTFTWDKYLEMKIKTGIRTVIFKFLEKLISTVRAGL